MLEKIKIHNFKSIVDLDVNFKNINILCGNNGEGKTSIIHAILLCCQSINNSNTADGKIIKIGDYLEIKNENLSDEIKIILTDNLNQNKEITYKRNEDVSEQNPYILNVNPSSQENIYSFEYEKGIFYLSSNKAGITDTYKKGNNIFGSDGSETISFLFNHRDNSLNENYLNNLSKYLIYKGKSTDICKSPNFFKHVRFWFEYITGETIRIEPIPQTNQFILFINYGSRGIRTINTGTGFSFVLPIIIACLGSVLISKDIDIKPTIIIENPEVFLHPLAQEKLGDFFLFCSDFIQLIIETHSEYIIKQIADKKIKDAQLIVVHKNNNHTEIQYFDKEQFKTDSYLEIIYRAFGIATKDLHILLYDMFQQKSSNVDSIKNFDEFLIEQFPNIPKKQRIFKNRTYNSLPTYIRNSIHHPSGKDANGNEYRYNLEELKQSIDFMLDNIENIK